MIEDDYPDSERTLSAHAVDDAIRRPTFEMQQEAIRNGYGSVRDWVLDQAVTEIRLLKARVERLEQPIRVQQSPLIRLHEDDGA